MWIIIGFLCAILALIGILNLLFSWAIDKDSTRGALFVLSVPLYIVIAVLGGLMIYRLIRAAKEFRFYIGTIVSWIAAAAVFLLTGMKFNGIVFLLLYVGLMILTGGTLLVGRNVYEDRLTTIYGIVALSVLQVSALGIWFHSYAGEGERYVLTTVYAIVCLYFQAAFFIREASQISK